MHLAAKALLDETLVRYTRKSPPVNVLIGGNVWKNTATENGKVKMENRPPGAICIVSQNAGLTTFDGWKLLKIKGRQRALAERCTSRRSVRDPKTGFEGWKVGRRVEIGRGGAYLAAARRRISSCLRVRRSRRPGPAGLASMLRWTSASSCSAWRCWSVSTQLSASSQVGSLASSKRISKSRRRSRSSSAAATSVACTGWPARDWLERLATISAAKIFSVSRPL